MKALSIKQPWAWAILNAGKDIENRNWKTNFRGKFYIHASKKFDKSGYLWLKENAEELFKNNPILQYKSKLFKMGGIIGIAEIVDCVDNSDSEWFFGPFGFVLDNIKPIDFIPIKGKLGFFEVEIR